jgi:hypothetical protein
MFKKLTFLLVVILLLSPASYAIIQQQPIGITLNNPLLGMGLNGLGGSIQTTHLFTSQTTYNYNFANNILPQQNLGLIGCLPLGCSTLMPLSPQLSLSTGTQMMPMMIHSPMLMPMLPMSGLLLH